MAAPEGGLQGPVRALQEQLRAEQARAAYLQRLLYQSRDALQQEREQRIEAERSMQVGWQVLACMHASHTIACLQSMVLQLRSMGAVLPNMVEPDAGLIEEETPKAKARRSMMLEDSDELIDLMALGKLQMKEKR